MKRYALAVAMLLASPSVLVAGPWNQTVSAAQKKAQSSKELIFVDLYADWCGWCHRMEQEVFPAEPFQKETADMVLLRLNTEDGADGTKLAQKYGVSSLPTFIVLTPELELAGRIRGFYPAKEFIEQLRGVKTREKDFVTAVAHEDAIANDYQKRFTLAQQFTERYQPKEAEARLRKLTGDAKTPADIRDNSYYELALAQLMQNKYDDAKQTINAFAKIRKDGDTYERTRMLLVEVYLEQHDNAAALNELKAFKASHPNSPLLVNVEGMIPELERAVGKR